MIGAPGMPSYRIVITDECRMIREMVRRTVTHIEAVEVVGDTGEGFECIEMVNKLKPDLVILDISLTNENGIQVLRQIKDSHPKTKVLVLTMLKARTHISSALSCGADGFILKEDAVEDLINAVEKIRQGGIYISDLILTHVLQFMRESTTNRSGHDPCLSERERRIADLISEGKSVSEIAEMMSLGRTAVYNLRCNIRKKLCVKRDVDLVRKLRDIPQR